ncbi:phytase [Thermaurantiacus sp.]
MVRILLLPFAALLGLAACGPDRREAVAHDTAQGPAAPVPASAETFVPDNPAVDADDPVLWADPSDPVRALLIGTDKSRGLYVHALDGRMLQFFPVGPLNNVDLRAGVVLGGVPRVLVAAAQRDRFGIHLFTLDPGSIRLAEAGFLATPSAFGEPYGFCMGQWAGETFLIVNNKAGEVLAFRVTDGGSGPGMAQAYRWKLGSQTEGCVVDDATGALFIGEEDVGIWRLSLARPDAPPAMFAPADGTRLVADVEGLTLMRDGGRTFLVASSQGDSAYAVFELLPESDRFVGRFRIGGGRIDPVSQTDGLDAWSGPIGPLPEGAIAVHDHCDSATAKDPPAEVCNSDGKQQNYKLIDWREVRAALGLRPAR